MTVNSVRKVFSKPRLRLFAVILFVQPVVLLLAAFLPDNQGLRIKQLNIALRGIGHHLLLSDGDSTSRVLPVIEKSKGVFVVEFENEFGFEPDTLIAATQRVLARMELPQYTVTVQECNTPRIVYGFEIMPPDEVTIPCRGRRQPRACYNIEVAFAEFPTPGGTYVPAALIVSGILSGLALILFVGNVAIKKTKPLTESNPLVQNAEAPADRIGILVFDTMNRTLGDGKEIVSLTDKETRILSLLNRNIGRLTLREELIQEVWTDEGVITGRSLDMFISKLRKKLSGDPRLRITNIHGRGYRLEIVDDPGQDDLRN